MQSAQEYAQQVQVYIQQIQANVLPFQERINRVGVNTSSLNEAKIVLNQLRSIQKQLRQIKRNINLDMKTIRAEYRQKASTAASFSAAILRGAGKRKKAGQVQADAKRRLIAERDIKLAPYDRIKLQIDDLLIKMDDGKNVFEVFIDMAKAELQVQAQNTENQKGHSS